MPHLLFLAALITIASLAIEQIMEPDVALTPTLVLETATTNITAEHKKQDPTVPPDGDRREATPKKTLPKVLPPAPYKQLPRFTLTSKCEEELYVKDKKECADDALIKYIYKNVKIPKEYLEQGRDGVVIIQFTVTENGKIDYVLSVMDRGYGTGEAIIEVLKGINNIPNAWLPGKLGKKAVAMKCRIPIQLRAFRAHQ